jgi:hypothetical protein
MFPTLQIGPLALQVPGLVILIAIWAGLSLSEHHAGKFGIKSSDLYNLAILMLAAGIIGARLMYIVHYPQAFLASPSSMISINPGLLDPVGGLAAGLLAGLIYIQRKGMPLWTSGNRNKSFSFRCSFWCPDKPALGDQLVGSSTPPNPNLRNYICGCNSAADLAWNRSGETKPSGNIFPELHCTQCRGAPFSGSLSR